MSRITELKRLVGKKISDAKVFVDEEERCVVMQLEFADGDSLCIEPDPQCIPIRVIVYEGDNLDEVINRRFELPRRK